MQMQAAKMREFTSVREMQAHYAEIRKKRLAVRAIEELTKPMPAKIAEPETPTINSYFIADDKYVELYVIERAPELLPPIVQAKIRVIQERVARFYDSQVIDMISARRDRKSCWPRQIAMYLCKTRTTKSLPEIGRRFGGRDHTTVLHAVRKIAELRPSDMKLDGELRELEAGLSG